MSPIRSALRAVALVLTGMLSASAGGDELPPVPGRFLIVCPPTLEPVAREWSAYRASGGWSTAVLELSPDDPLPLQRLEAQEFIRAHAADFRGVVCVLLLGDVPSDDAPGVPTFRFRQSDPDLTFRGDDSFVTDHPYQVTEQGSLLPAVALGRVPARTCEEARAVLEKVRRYEHEATPGPWRRRVNFVAGQGHYGMMDRVLELLFRVMVDEYVPDAFDVTMTYAKATSIYCPAPADLNRTVLERLGEGALLFNYIGHGRADRFDALRWGRQSFPLLRAEDLERLEQPPSQAPIALLTCCSAGWFDGERTSLAEVMLLHPHGPVAVLAGSRVTHPYANAVFQRNVTELLLAERVETVGQLDLQATLRLVENDRPSDRAIDALAAPVAAVSKWKTPLTELRRMHMQLYQLFGDPALRIRYPDATARLTLEGGTLHGRIPSMTRGRATVTIETPRTRPTRSHALRPPTGPDPEARAEALRHNYVIANDVVLRTIEAPVRDGVFDLELELPLPSNAVLIKAHAEGLDSTGAPFDAFGAVRLPTSVTAPGK